MTKDSPEHRADPARGLGRCAPAAQPPGQKAPPLPKPFESQAASSVSLTGTKDGEQTVEILNTAFDITGDIPVSGRPRGTRTLLRTTTRSKRF